MCKKEPTINDLLVSQIISLEALVTLLQEKDIISADEFQKRIDEIKQKVTAKPPRFRADDN